MTSVEWTPERISQAREWWMQGFSYRQISKFFGDVTVGAVSGLVNREGFPRRNQMNKEEFTKNSKGRRTTIKKWSQAELKTAKEMYLAGKTIPEIAKRLDRSEGSVGGKVYEMRWGNERRPIVNKPNEVDARRASVLTMRSVTLVKSVKTRERFTFYPKEALLYAPTWT